MFGVEMSVIDWAFLIGAIVVTLYVMIAKNPFKEGTNEHQGIRLCRVGLALLLWGFNFGLIGVAFAVTAFILGIIGIVKGRTAYGIMLIAGSVIMPFASLLTTFSNFIPR